MQTLTIEKISSVCEEAQLIPINDQNTLVEHVNNMLDLGISWELIEHNVETFVKTKIPQTKSDEDKILDSEQTFWYMFSPFVQMTLPHSDINENIYLRTNSLNEIKWVCGAGVPSGFYARILLFYISSIVVKYSTKEIPLGRSRRSLLADLGIKIGGSQSKAVKEQLIRLSESFLTLKELKQINNSVKNVELENVRLFSKASFWWDNDYDLKQAVLVVSDEFYEALKELGTAVPFNKEIIQSFTKCMDLDVYTLLAYRTHKGCPQKPIPWLDLMKQIGAGYTDPNVFKFRFLQSVKNVSAHLPKIKCSPLDNGLLLSYKKK